MTLVTENEKAKKREEEPNNGKPKHTSPPSHAVTPTRIPLSRENSIGRSDDHDEGKKEGPTYDGSQSLDNLLKIPEFVADFTQYMTDAGFVDAVYCWNELQNYKTLQKGTLFPPLILPETDNYCIGYLPSYARGIYYKYFVSQASRVGVDGLTVRDIAVKLTAPDPALFVKAEKQVFTFLEKQWLPNFLSNRDPKHVSFGIVPFCFYT